ncbi:SAF domain-containing protein [Microbacterium terrisoli]|uniref:SAF domain-containing protein n=1 Tax=Microbacterium terrisoli TaxID=3242192 RepID=UPI00280457A0|nr:SAF domain-containing protein [Microbacterium protaetiae]
MSALGSFSAPPDARPSVRPRRRVFWTDARFLLGIVLIVAAIGGVWAVVTLSRQTSPVYAAAHTLVPGQAVTSSDLTVVEVALGAARERYLAPGAALSDAVATRTVQAGELVPASATVPAAQSSLTSVVVHSSADVPSAVRAGTVVELWSAAQTERGVFATPRVLIPRATVVSVQRDDSMLGAGAAAIELRIERADVASTLEAISAQAALSIVPTGAAR